MLSKLFYLVALILFVVIALANKTTDSINIAWPLACVAAGLLIEGYSPNFPR